MLPSEHAQHQSPRSSSHEKNTAITDVMNFTRAFHHHVCREKSILPLKCCTVLVLKFVLNYST